MFYYVIIKDKPQHVRNMMVGKTSSRIEILYTEYYSRPLASGTIQHISAMSLLGMMGRLRLKIRHTS